LVESRQLTFYTHVLKVYINFQRKKNKIQKITELTGTIPVSGIHLILVSVIFAHA